MKSFALLGLAIFLNAALCRGNPMSDAHLYLHALHLDQKHYFDGVRSFIELYSVMTADELMDIFARELEALQRRGKTCRGNTWQPRNTEEFGEELSICVFGATTHLDTVKNLILGNVEEAQVETLDMQLTLMKELQTYNILEHYNEFYAHAQELGRQMRERFYEERYPRLIENHDALEWSAENLPRLLQECIDAIPVKIKMNC